ncbi:tripartite tricarboxylate transporter TctB family protein [Kiloniella sp.]|uniref:tripartite tricarboxylate transporter TctB family protein n=1 Tax=Kiloniella sp. TaxID=1938587 RepID=UPI003A8E9ADD
MRQDFMDKLFSLLMIVFAITSGIVAFQYSYESSYFPRLLSAFIAAVALLLFVRLKSASGKDESAVVDGIKDQTLAGLSVFTGIALYAVSIQIINFELSTIIFIAGFVFYLGYRNLLIICGVSLGVTVLLYGIFFEFLAVSRPESLFLR